MPTKNTTLFGNTFSRSEHQVAKNIKHAISLAVEVALKELCAEPEDGGVNTWSVSEPAPNRYQIHVRRQSGGPLFFEVIVKGTL